MSDFITSTTSTGELWNLQVHYKHAQSYAFEYIRLQQDVMSKTDYSQQPMMTMHLSHSGADTTLNTIVY